MNRYASAARLADDLWRFWVVSQSGRAGGRVERAAKWCERNPVLAALA